MSKLPFMPLYVPDYEGATNFLSIAEDGMYMRSLRLMWSVPGCSLPDDKEWIKKRLRITEEEYQDIFLFIKEEFFFVKSGRIMQKRLQHEYCKAGGIIKARSVAGKLGVKAKALKRKEKDASKGNDLFKQNVSKRQASISTSTPTSKVRKKPSVSKENSKGSRMKEDFELPEEWITFAKTLSYTKAEAQAVFDRFKDYWLGVSGQKGTKVNWLATWRNWLRRDRDDGKSKGNDAVHRPYPS